MELIIKIAWRNILRHKGKSVIIGVILFIGALLMTVGNGVVSGMNRGLEENIVNSFMGHIVIMSDKEKSDNILFKMYGETIESFANYKEINSVLEKFSFVEKNLPIGKNMAMILNEDEGDPGMSNLVGVDFKRYKEMFPDNYILLEGSALENSTPGVMMPQTERDTQYKTMNIWFIPENSSLDEKNLIDEAKENKDTLNLKSSVVFMGFNDTNSSTDIRLPVKGVFKYRALNTIWGHFTIMDIESYRQCLGYFSAGDLDVELTGEKKELFSMESENLDNMFSSSPVVVSSNSSSSTIADFSEKKSSVVETVDVDAGAYNLIFVKLKKSGNLDGYVKKINAELTKNNLGVKAVTWKKAAGPIGGMATIIKGALFMFVMFLFIVAVIIIVNTLTMAALERTTEIGMMRAIGARKSFISSMFIGETALLSGFFGGGGILTGIIIVKIIPLLKISTDNDMIQLIYGGDIFTPFLSVGDIMLTVIQLVIVTLITVVYPVKVAKNITPLDAISRD